MDLQMMLNVGGSRANVECSRILRGALLCKRRRYSWLHVQGFQPGRYAVTIPQYAKAKPSTPHWVILEVQCKLQIARAL